MLFRSLMPRACWPLALLLLLALAGQAQTAQEPFGRVRIQYRKFDWQEFTTQNFTVMYYGGGETSARRTVDYAEKELQRISALIGYYPYSKTTLMLYNSVGDLRQSNIGLSNDLQVTGGESQLTRMSKVQIAFTGQQTDFKRELSFQITQVLLNDMMYGGSLKEALQSSYLLQLPDWFIGGASAYAAEGWSVEMDSYMRDMTRRHPNTNRTAPFFLRDSRLAGQSIWNYVAERYGYTSIQNILNLTRITRDIEVGISSSLNVPFRVFLRDWLTYYRNQNQVTASLRLPADSTRQGGRNRRNAVFSQPVISPNGQQVAYALNDDGRYRVMVANRDGSHRQTISRGGYKTPDQQVETRLPVLAWRGNAEVAVAEMSHGQMTLRLRDASGRALLSRVVGALSFSHPASLFDAYDQVLSMSYSTDGKALVFSAVHNGQNDLYLLRAGSRRVEQLTDDLFDDVQPVFMPDGQSLVFSSNRYLDSLGRARPATFPNVVNNYDLFQYHLDGRALPVTVLVSTISNETRPRALSNDEIAYLGEESGVRGLYRYSLRTRQRQPLSQLLPNVQDFDYNSSSEALAFVAANEGRDNVYFYPRYTLPTTLVLGKTARQQTLEDRSNPRPTAKPAPKATAARPDSATGPGLSRRARRRANEAVNISEYEFEEDEPAPVVSKRRVPATKTVATVTATAPTVAGPYRYDTRFTVDNLSAALYQDPLLGLGIQLRARLNDALENHRFDASIFVPDLRTSNIVASYTNLTKRFDWSVTYQKQAYFLDVTQEARTRFGRHVVSPTIAYPLTHNLSVRGGPQYVNLTRTLTNRFDSQQDLTQNYLGAQGELVFDNTIVTGVNMLRGTRMKVSIMQLQSLDHQDLSFGKLTVDLRHYQKLSRSLVWANRVSYGQFLGPNPQYFRLGGMDNWLNADYSEDPGYPGGRLAFANTTNTSTPPATSYDASQVFYQQFVTNMRGFDYGARTGSHYLLFNSELRFPIVQYFARRPIYSGFFRNLQLTGFTDIGSAYSGSTPFDETDSDSKPIIGYPFSASIYRSPFLVGYGVGARTTLLGFYAKLDVAWGQDNYVNVGPKTYLTLGYDF